ncbi:MAG: Hpt domain-containing protein, partial [Roseicyclus sp.]|nr:Hpt domain-containing protein [Roseicyclus sp.]
MSDEMDEIWELYADDGSQALDAMEAALEALMAGGDDPDRHVAALFRAVHTFKGNSRVLGLSVVESRAHLSEDLIGLVRDAGVPLTSEILDCLMEAGDHLRRMLDETAQTRADVDPTPSEGLAERLRALIARLGDGEEDAAGDTGEAMADPEAAEPEP